ncbi:MAG: hypothetical protein F4X97_05010 [Boseongicola sp. SB0662_bin_57]|nr:hypothetical protein [Boseongicola sp. SB0662_bin_57]
MGVSLCRISLGLLLPDDGSKPVTMTLAGRHGRNAELIAMEGLPVTGTEFGLSGLSLAWTWEERSYAIHLKPAIGVASHFQVLDDGTIAGPECSCHCGRTGDTPREPESVAARADADAKSRQVAPHGPPLIRGERLAHFAHEELLICLIGSLPCEEVVRDPAASRAWPRRRHLPVLATTALATSTDDTR